MNFGPSTIDRFLAELPEDLQILALEALAEEHKRWEEGRLTPEEKESFKTFEELGRTMAQTLDGKIMEIMEVEG